MRVARVIAALEPGGAQLGALRLSLSLRAHGIESRWLAGHATREGLAIFRASGVDVEVLGGGPALQHARRRAFAQRLAEALDGEQLAHAHMFGGWWAAARRCRRGCTQYGPGPIRRGATLLAIGATAAALGARGSSAATFAGRRSRHTDGPLIWPTVDRAFVVGSSAATPANRAVLPPISHVSASRVLAP